MYEQQIVAVGLHGSVARGNDGPGSDIDFVVVTAPGRADAIAGRVARIEGVIVDLGVVSEPDYLAEASALGSKWPLAAEQYVRTQVLHDPTAHFERLRAAHEQLLRSTPRARFVAGSTPHVLAAIAASDKAADALSRTLAADAYRHVVEASLSLALALGFLRQQYFNNTTQAVTSLPTIAPTEVRADLQLVVSEIDMTAVVPALTRSVQAVAQFAEDEGAVLDLETVEQMIQ